jgi:hypothetical protein
MFAVLVDNTGFSELNYDLFLALNDKAETEEVALLYLNLSNNIMPNDFPIMNVTEMYSMWGDNILVATCLKTASMLEFAAVNCKKVIYFPDLRFILTPYKYQEMLKILKSMTIIVRSEDHRRVIRDLFNLDAYVISNFSIEEIENAICSQQQNNTSRSLC